MALNYFPSSVNELTYIKFKKTSNKQLACVILFGEDHKKHHESTEKRVNLLNALGIDQFLKFLDNFNAKMYIESDNTKEILDLTLINNSKILIQPEYDSFLEFIRTFIWMEKDKCVVKKSNSISQVDDRILWSILFPSIFQRDFFKGYKNANQQVFLYCPYNYTDIKYYTRLLTVFILHFTKNLHKFKQTPSSEEKVLFDHMLQINNHSVQNSVERCVELIKLTMYLSSLCLLIELTIDKQIPLYKTYSILYTKFHIYNGKEFIDTIIETNIFTLKIGIDNTKHPIFSLLDHQTVTKMDLEVVRDIITNKHLDVFFYIAGSNHTKYVSQLLKDHHKNVECETVQISNTNHVNLYQFFSNALKDLRSKEQITTFLEKYSALFISTPTINNKKQLKRTNSTSQMINKGFGQENNIQNDINSIIKSFETLDMTFLKLDNDFDDYTNQIYERPLMCNFSVHDLVGKFKFDFTKIFYFDQQLAIKFLNAQFDIKILAEKLSHELLQAQTGYITV